MAKWTIERVAILFIYLLKFCVFLLYFVVVILLGIHLCRFFYVIVRLKINWLDRYTHIDNVKYTTFIYFIFLNRYYWWRIAQNQRRSICCHSFQSFFCVCLNAYRKPHLLNQSLNCFVNAFFPTFLIRIYFAFYRFKLTHENVFISLFIVFCRWCFDMIS